MEKYLDRVFHAVVENIKINKCWSLRGEGVPPPPFDKGVVGLQGTSEYDKDS